MIYAFRNFKRNTMLNLTAQSVRHFDPNARIIATTFYEENYDDEYSELEPLLSFIDEFKFKTKYPNTSGRPVDALDQSNGKVGITSGVGNPNNHFFFSEGYNAVWEVLKNDNPKKVLMLGEDHFFTTGAVIQELKENENNFAIAYGSWCWWGYEPKWASGSCVCFDLEILKNIFPLPSPSDIRHGDGQPVYYIEGYLYQILARIPPQFHYIMKNRTFENHHGDGLYTNSSQKIREELQKANII